MVNHPSILNAVLANRQFHNQVHHSFPVLLYLKTLIPQDLTQSVVSLHQFLAGCLPRYFWGRSCCAVECISKSMAQLPPQTPPGTYQRAVETKKEVPDELAEIVARSLKIGASTGMCTVTKISININSLTDWHGLGTGACGVLFGATAGIVRGTTPVLFSLVSGIQWFGLGSVYYGKPSISP